MSHFLKVRALKFARLVKNGSLKADFICKNCFPKIHSPMKIKLFEGHFTLNNGIRNFD